MRVYMLAVIFFVAVALPAENPEPGQLALVFSEDDFEDYLDSWLEKQQVKSVNTSSAFQLRNGCVFRVNGDLGQPQPLYISSDTYFQPAGTTGSLTLNASEQIIVACTGSDNTIQHPNITSPVAVATARCENGAWISGAGWLQGIGAFGQLTCASHAVHYAIHTNHRCWGNNFVLRVGFVVNNIFYPLYSSCFNQQRLEVLYVWYDQTPENAFYQSDVERPSWQAGLFFHGVDVDSMYTQVQQKATIAKYVGQALADRYVTNTQYLTRGHLAARTDFVFATGQRASFYFINAAPQWQPFNAGNWNWLEQNLRTRIAAAGYRTVIYTGTFGVCQLRDQGNRLIDIFLVRNRNQIPVPLYFYKVVYDASRLQGTAFVSINNPYYTLDEARALTFCTDRCRNNMAFSWLGWQPDRVDIGYSFCCTVDDFRRTVPHLPAFTTTGLLT